MGFECCCNSIELGSLPAILYPEKQRHASIANSRISGPGILDRRQSRVPMSSTLYTCSLVVVDCTALRIFLKKINGCPLEIAARCQQHRRKQTRMRMNHKIYTHNPRMKIIPRQKPWKPRFSSYLLTFLL